jgi:hypothetical protein
LRRSQRRALHLLHFAYRGRRIVGNRTDVDTDLTSDRVAIAVRAALEAVIGCAGKTAANRAMRLLMGALALLANLLPI